MSSAAMLAATAQQAALKAAEHLRLRYRDDAVVRSQSGRDIKTEADEAAEQVLLAQLAGTGLPVLSEEGGGQTLAEVRAGRHWIVDPLDGTLNFSRRFPMACVSVALWHGNRPEIGVVVDLARNRVLAGAMGAGAFADDAAMRASSVTNERQAILATGFPTGCSHDTDRLQAFVSLVQRFKKVRLLGSAALSLGYIAEGVFDAYCEEDIWIWDVAAGVALVLVAGGAVWMTAPNSQGQVTVFASNGFITPPESLFTAHEDLEKYSHT